MLEVFWWPSWNVWLAKVTYKYQGTAHPLFHLPQFWKPKYLYVFNVGGDSKTSKSEQGGGQWKSRGARTSYQILVEVIITIWRVCWQICNDILHINLLHINLLLILIISCKGASRVELSLRITSISMNLKEGMGNSQLAKLCCLSRTANPCSTNVKPHTYVPTQRAEHCVHRSDP